MLVVPWPTIDKGDHETIRTTRGSFVFRACNGIAHGTPALSRPFPPSRREGGADAAHKEPGRPSLAGFRRRGGELRSQCFWHLIFCAELTRSAPLGSQCMASLNRRSQSSPSAKIIAGRYLRFIRVTVCNLSRRHSSTSTQSLITVSTIPPHLASKVLASKRLGR